MFHVICFIAMILLFASMAGHLYLAIWILSIIAFLFIVAIVYAGYIGGKDLELREKAFDDFYLNLSSEEVTFCDSYYKTFFNKTCREYYREKFDKIDFSDKIKVDKFFAQLKDDVKYTYDRERREQRRKFEEYAHQQYYRSQQQEKFNKTTNDYSKHFKILQVSENCSKNDIRKSYLRLAKIYHPDKGIEKSDERFIELKKSYDLLMMQL